MQISKLPLSALVAALTLTVAISGPAVASAEPGASGPSNPTAIQARQKNYRATRPFVIDQQTGEARLPTESEIAELAANLAKFVNRDDTDLQPIVTETNGIAIDQEGFGSVVLARPTSDGGWETNCVFTIEEGLAFLGIVEDAS
jgi:hypothetical protein